MSATKTPKSFEVAWKMITEGVDAADAARRAVADMRACARAGPVVLKVRLAARHAASKQICLGHVDDAGSAAVLLREVMALAANCNTVGCGSESGTLRAALTEAWQFLTHAERLEVARRVGVPDAEK